MVNWRGLFACGPSTGKKPFQNMLPTLICVQKAQSNIQSNFGANVKKILSGNNFHSFLRPQFWSVKKRASQTFRNVKKEKNKPTYRENWALNRTLRNRNEFRISNVTNSWLYRLVITMFILFNRWKKIKGKKRTEKIASLWYLTFSESRTPLISVLIIQDKEKPVQGHLDFWVPSY